MSDARTSILLLYSLYLAACTPMAAVGMLGSTLIKTAEHASENSDSTVTQYPVVSQDYNRKEIAVANLNLGIAYMQQGHYQLALEKMTRAKIAKPDFAPTYNALGLLYQRIGEMEMAEESFKYSLKLSPDDSGTLNNYGLLLCQNERYEEADKVFNESASNPLYSTPEIAISNAGTCALKNGKPEIAENYFKQALNKNPAVGPALIQMAEILYDRGDYLSSRDYLHRYLAINDHTPKTLWLGIRIERELGDKDALASYELLLRNKFSDSKEAQLLEESRIN